MAAVMFLLLRGVEGTAAWMARIALAVFAVVYLVFEALAMLIAAILLVVRARSARAHAARSGS
jgi:uncharacterized membrane protein YtjA (UPF0391 family)